MLRVVAVPVAVRPGALGVAPHEGQGLLDLALVEVHPDEDPGVGRPAQELQQLRALEAQRPACCASPRTST